MQNRTVMPTTWLLLALLLMVGLHSIIPLRGLVVMPWRLIGLLPLVLGVALNLIADKAFHQAQTTVKSFQESTTLMTTGVFRFTRNPMYLGFLLTLGGVALLLGSVTPWLVIAPFIWLLDRAYIAVEEQMLAKTFGAAWDAYRARVRRWF